MQIGVAAQVAVPVKKMRGIVTLTVNVKVDWFVGLIIVRLVFLVRHMIVVRSHQVCFTLMKLISGKLRVPRVDAPKQSPCKHLCTIY